MMKNPLSITRLTIILGAVAMAGCTPSMSDPASIEPVASSAGFSQTEAAEIKQSYMRNAVRSTLHRTWHYYENDQASADVLFDLLDEEVVISTPAGTFDGRGAFEAFVADLQINHANGHRLRSVEINPQSDGLIGLNAEVEYVAIGASEDGEAGSTLTPLYYSGTMNLDPISGLAKIMALKIELGQSGPSSAYPDAYVNNRLLSLAHHFHAMIENPNRSAETFDEVLAEEFSLSFPGQEIDDPEAFAAWIESISPILQASEHDLIAFNYDVISENTYQARMEYAWRGIRADGSGAKARSELTWTVIDDPAERFAKVKSATLTFLEPITPL